MSCTLGTLTVHVSNESGPDDLTVLNTCRNEPHVHFAKMEPNPGGWRGSELSVTILGNWQYYRAKVS